jgi:hypothetical protein
MQQPSIGFKVNKLLPQGWRYCYKCRNIKRVEDFSADACKDCCAEYHRSYRASKSAQPKLVLTPEERLRRRRERCRNYYRKNREKFKEYGSVYYQTHKEELQQAMREYIKSNHERLTAYRKAKYHTPEGKARAILQYAVTIGKIDKPSQCSMCHAELPKRKIHGHHEDYSEPLEVIWVCSPCHKHHFHTQEAVNA